MISLELTDNRAFMSKLLLSEAFDHFRTLEASITTYNTFHIDGLIHPEFYMDSPEDTISAKSIASGEADAEAAREPEAYSLWKDLRPVCFSLIKGKRSPLRFKIVLFRDAEAVGQLLEEKGLSSLIPYISGMILTILFEDGALTCVTGVSMKSFTMNKEGERLWDETVQDFLNKMELPFLLR